MARETQCQTELWPNYNLFRILLRRKDDRTGQLLSSDCVTGHHCGVVQAPPQGRGGGGGAPRCYGHGAAASPREGSPTAGGGSRPLSALRHRGWRLEGLRGASCHHSNGMPCRGEHGRTVLSHNPPRVEKIRYLLQAEMRS